MVMHDRDRRRLRKIAALVLVNHEARQGKARHNRKYMRTIRCYAVDSRKMNRLSVSPEILDEDRIMPLTRIQQNSQNDPLTTSSHGPGALEFTDSDC